MLVYLDTCIVISVHLNDSVLKGLSGLLEDWIIGLVRLTDPPIWPTESRPSWTPTSWYNSVFDPPVPRSDQVTCAGWRRHPRILLTENPGSYEGERHGDAAPIGRAVCNPRAIQRGRDVLASLGANSCGVPKRASQRWKPLGTI